MMLGDTTASGVEALIYDLIYDYVRKYLPCCRDILYTYDVESLITCTFGCKNV